MANLRRKGPNLNTGEPWSAMDDADLAAMFTKGEPIKQKAVIEAAEFLCRNGAEIRTRLRELGYMRGPAKRTGRP
jgi:hypothetical protein